MARNRISSGSPLSALCYFQERFVISLEFHDMTKRPNIFFHLAVAAGVLFILTVLALTAMIFSGPRAPLARLLDDHGGTLIAVEVAAILAFSFFAMALDRRQTLRQTSNPVDAPANDSGITPEGNPDNEPPTGRSSH